MDPDSLFIAFTNFQNPDNPFRRRPPPPTMTERQVTLQKIVNLLTKLSDPDADLRFMSLNDLFDILTNPDSAFLCKESRFSSDLADGLLKCLEDCHGDVQNQALKWYVQLSGRAWRRYTTNWPL